MRDLGDLEREIGYQFADRSFLTRALTHSSHAHERSSDSDNEQFEFLGDAILGFIISDVLCREHPRLNEGQLSRIKGFLVSASNLVKYAEQIRLGEYLHLGRGEEKTGGRMKQTLLVDGFEALLAAVYLDGGLDAARGLAMRFFAPQIRGIGHGAEELADYKSGLTEALLKEGRAAEYILASESGPDHQKLFIVEVCISGEAVASGIGLTKKAAEQAAAKHALAKLREFESETV